MGTSSRHCFVEEFIQVCFRSKKQFKNEDYSIVEVHGWARRSQQPKWKDPGYGFEEDEASHRFDSFVCNNGFGYDLGDLLLLPFGLTNHRCQLVEEARTPRILQEQAVQILQPIWNGFCQGRMQSTHLQGLKLVSKLYLADHFKEHIGKYIQDDKM